MTGPTASPARRKGAHGLRHNYAMTVLGTILPGAGLLRTRMRRAGLLLLGIAALVLIGLIVKIVRDGVVGAALEVGLSRDTLLVLIWGVLIGAVVWMASIVVTAAVTRPNGLSRDERLASSMVAFLCCLAVAAPSAYAVRTLGIQRSVVAEVFEEDTPAASGDGTVAVPDVEADDPWENTPRVNLLFIGSDAAEDRVGVRPDSMMVASINTQTGDTVLIGIPRNLENAPIPATNPLSTLYPDGYNCGDACLINGIWTLATDHPDLFPGEDNPGLRSTRDVVGEVVGLSIDNTIVVDLSGFAALVDAMGGVEIDVKERVCVGCRALSDGTVVSSDGGEVRYIEPGVQRLDGYHALWYARSRATTDDYSRMRRQRCVMGALIDQVSPANMLRRYPDLAEVLKSDVDIDIPQSHLSAWVPLIERIQSEGTLRSLALTNTVIDVVRPDYDAIHAMVANAISDNPTTTTSSTSASPSGTSSTSETTTPSESSTDPGTGSETSTDEPSDGLTTIAAAC